jgi:hypothetical protein
VKVTDDPGQKGFDDAVIVTPAAMPEMAFIVMLLLDAGFPVVQVADEVRTQVTKSPFAGLYV